MPYLNLRLSPALKDHDWTPFFKEAHAYLSQYTQIQNCKSSIYYPDHTYIGAGSEQDALVYLEVLVKSRPPEVLEEIAKTLLDLFTQHATPLLTSRGLHGTPALELRVLTHYL
jgi:5-carboxymethyl-2-hydroxymuconate isomerase